MRRVLVAVLAFLQAGGTAPLLTPSSSIGRCDDPPSVPAIHYNIPPSSGPSAAAVNTLAPRTLRNASQPEAWEMRLEEALQLALAHSKVMVDSGGRVLQAPITAQTVYDPALRETDPLAGPMAALSAFDAQLTSNAFWRQGSNFNNNLLLGGGTYFLDSNQFFNDTGVTKRAATGGIFRLGSNTEYVSSSAPYNFFTSVASTAVGGEVIQPLLRGAGADFNRVAGVYAIPGGFNGVVLGRINTDISLLDFEAAVRSVLIDVERAYWDLAMAYRDLDVKIAARDATLETWRLIHRKLQIGALGADEEAEARAREQYYLLQAQVENAYSGAAPISAALGSTVGNAVLGNSAGVLGNERRLRQLLGLPPTDNRLIRPVTEPTHAAVSFDWQKSLTDALTRRVELRRQTLTVRRREAELSATRNLRLPRLDAVAGVNYRTFSNELSQTVIPPNSLSSSFGNVNYNVGFNFSMPLGNRLAKTAVRNAELQLARERAILEEQRLHVSHELTNSIVEMDRAFTVMNTSYNRRAAAEQQTAAVMRKYEVGSVGLEPVLDSQRRLADAEAAYFRAVFDYNRALADVHLARGTLLDYDGVKLADALNGDCSGDRFDWNLAIQNDSIDYRFSSPTTFGLTNGETSELMSPLPQWLVTAVADDDGRSVSIGTVLPETTASGDASPIPITTLPPVDMDSDRRHSVPGNLNGTTP